MPQITLVLSASFGRNTCDNTIGIFANVFSIRKKYAPFFTNRREQTFMFLSDVFTSIHETKQKAGDF